MLEIENDGQAILSTNYWSSDFAARGLAYLTWNAGAARLLIPAIRRAWLRDMEGADSVIISVGPWSAARGKEGVELLFEDHSDSPFALHLSQEQTDRLLPASEVGKLFKVIVLCEHDDALHFPGLFRRVPAIPFLKPWKK
ncbi:hypothetical protein [Shinella sumterensis]|uniref:Uncharacterized protein n=1 Tax=Shinella sumterensis TaxID=1967501 RepID=A0AA50CS22_9HYPH|nr:hypothetical protein [Shinella sumterensis]WLS01004.1 hypothetical protein Q9313_26780 [Shinella sumterensis]WLS11784.1 hypothetical protein Q9314_27515 [Shinella sumterensis]